MKFVLDFKTPQLSDKAWVSAIMRESGELACEYCFGNLYMWCTVYGNTIARYGDLFLARDGTEKPAYLFPCGKGDKKKAILELKEAAKTDGSPLTLYCLTPKKVHELDCMFPGEFDFQPTREYFDYIYNTQDLIDLAGRRYHGKRNHIAYFKKTFDWHYEPLTERNMADCLAMNEKWEQRNREKNPEDIDNELVAIHRAFDNYFDLELTGGVLYADGEIVAYTFGEPLNDTAFCTHVEKAFADVRGAYPAINREFAANALSGFHFVNREEDAGSEGLRRAKESYYPVVLLPKYTAVCKE